MTDLTQALNFYSNLLQQDFVMSNNPGDSLFNKYVTKPDNWTVKIDETESKKEVKLSETHQNKIKTINIPNATIKRHSHIRSRRSSARIE